MTGIEDLDKLIKEMRPELADGEYVFCTLPENRFNELQLDPLLVYREREGITAVIGRKTADANSLPYSDVFSLITLVIHSNLSAIGFLAKIANKFAESGISVNVVSAYHHDHLFVPVKMSGGAMKILAELSGS